MISNSFIQSCQAGDEDAIETLVRTYQRTVFQLALSILDDSPWVAQRSAAPIGARDEPLFGFTPPGSVDESVVMEAEVATRQTFMTAIDRLGSYHEDSSFDTWIYALAVQVSLRRYRSWKFRRSLQTLWRAVPRLFARRARSVEPSIESGQPAGEHAAPGDAAVWASFCALKMNLRLPVVLRYYHDLSISDVARVLHLSEGAVHARLDAAREKIASAR